MGVFVVLLLVPMLIQHISIRGYHINHEKKNKTALAFFFLWLTILVMLRHGSVGVDTNSYKNYFDLYSGLDWITLVGKSTEMGYVYFNKIVSLISEDPQFFLAVAAVTVSFMIYPTYRQLCMDPSLTIMLYCTLSTFVMMFSGIRQMLAISIGVIAYRFTRDKKLIPFILTVLLAITFHASAFILAFMYPLYHIKITKKWLCVIIPALVIIFVLNKPIFSVLSLIIERYTEYEGGIQTTGAYTMLILFSLFTIFSYIIPDESVIDGETIALRNFLLFVFVIQMFAPVHALAMRMNYYYIIFIPLLLPRIIAYRKERWKQVATMGRHVMVVFFFVYFFVNAYDGIQTGGNGNLHVFPYHFFWENV